MKKELSFFESLRYCIYNEKDIEFRFRKEFEDKLKTKITSFGNSDGVIKTDDLHTLIEIKYNLDLTKREKQCSVIMQGLYYLRQKFFDLKKEIELIDSRLSVKIGRYDRENLLIKEIESNHIILKGIEQFYEKNRFFS